MRSTMERYALIDTSPMNTSIFDALHRERSTQFSPSLAAALGIEEAIVLQLLFNHRQAMLGQSSSSLLISREALCDAFPFWSIHDLQRIIKSLSDRDVITVKSAPITQSGLLEYNFAQTQVTLSPAPHAPEPEGRNRISPHWKPNNDTLIRLQQRGVDPQFASQQIDEFITFWQGSGKTSASWDAKFIKHAIVQYERKNAPAFLRGSQQEPATMQQQWTPNPDALEILQRNGISISFIEDTIPEFVLYWRERGDATNMWNSKFVQHVKNQWARYTNTLKYNTEPRRIQDNWEPDDDVYEMLNLSNIDLAFAKSLLPEFILYWRDTNQLHTSWNTKFLQHVKYHWAKRHHLIQSEANHAGQQGHHQSANATANSFVAKHTDRSWADGL